MLIIRVQVRFDELFPSSAQLGICMRKKGKAIDGLLDERFQAIYLIDVFFKWRPRLERALSCLSQWMFACTF